MGFFDKKYCDICGDKIGLLGNRKLEDGNLCKNCAKKLSPWFDERRHSTVDQIKKQLAYREENRANAAAFHTSRVIGNGRVKVYVDEGARKFAVTSANNFSEDNPDILDFSQAVGVDLNIDEHRREQHQTVDGKSVSYNPPRYEYSYDFKVTIRVSHPYFSEMKFNLNSGSVDTGERCMSRGETSAWNVNILGSLFKDNRGQNEYQQYVQMGNELKAMIDSWRGGVQQGFGTSAVNNGAQQGFGTSAMNNGVQQGFGTSAMNNGAQQGFGAVAMNTGAPMGGNMTSGRFGSAAPVPYAESVNGSVMTLQVNYGGDYAVSVLNPSLCQNFGGLEGLQNVLAARLNAVTAQLINECGNQGIPVAQLPAKSAEISNEIQNRLRDEWANQYGVALNNVSVYSITMTDASRQQYEQIARFRSQSAFGSEAQQSQAQQVYQQAQSLQAAQSAGWTCEYCGTTNTGNFCTGCGAKR